LHAWCFDLTQTYADSRRLLRRQIFMDLVIFLFNFLIDCLL